MSVSRKTLLRMGERAMLAVDGGASTGEVCDGLIAEVRRFVLEHYGEAAAGWAQTAAQDAVTASAGWAENGFPLLVPGQKLAASLMATRMPAEHAADVVAPWDCFAVAAPPGFLRLGDREVQHVGLWKTREGEFRVQLFTEPGIVSTATSYRSLADFARGHERDGDYGPPPNDMGPAYEPLAESLCRCFGLACRLVLGLCIELDQPRYREQIGAGPRKRPSRRGGPPSAWAFQVTRDVRVDLRDWVRSYASGDGREGAGVQVLVRGHHKRQRCGPGGSLRKWIHVEPYWRGPEEAPVAVRAHRVGA